MCHLGIELHERIPNELLEKAKNSRCYLGDVKMEERKWQGLKKDDEQK